MSVEGRMAPPTQGHRISRYCIRSTDHPTQTGIGNRLHRGVRGVTLITFEEVSTSFPLRASLNKGNVLVATVTSEASSAGTKALVAMADRGRRMAIESYESELQQILESSSISGDARRTVRDVGTAFIVASGVSTLVLQAPHASEGV